MVRSATLTTSGVDKKDGKKAGRGRVLECAFFARCARAPRFCFRPSRVGRGPSTLGCESGSDYPPARPIPQAAVTNPEWGQAPQTRRPHPAGIGGSAGGGRKFFDARAGAGADRLNWQQTPSPPLSPTPKRSGAPHLTLHRAMCGRARQIPANPPPCPFISNFLVLGANQHAPTPALAPPPRPNVPPQVGARTRPTRPGAGVGGGRRGKAANRAQRSTVESGSKSSHIARGVGGAGVAAPPAAAPHTHTHKTTTHRGTTTAEFAAAAAPRAARTASSTRARRPRRKC